MAQLETESPIVLPDDPNGGPEVQVDYPGYRSTRWRVAQRPLVTLPEEFHRVDGPVFGEDAIGEVDNDLTRQHSGEPIGERIIVTGRALSEVVRTALGLPPLTAAIDVDRQAQMIEQRINFDDFKNPAKLESFITRFLSLWELANPSTYSNPANLLIGRPIEAGFAPELLASFQNLRFARL